MRKGSERSGPFLFPALAHKTEGCGKALETAETNFAKERGMSSGMPMFLFVPPGTTEVVFFPRFLARPRLHLSMAGNGLRQSRNGKTGMSSSLIRTTVFLD